MNIHTHHADLAHLSSVADGLTDLASRLQASARKAEDANEFGYLVEDITVLKIAAGLLRQVTRGYEAAEADRAKQRAAGKN